MQGCYTGTASPFGRAQTNGRGWGHGMPWIAWPLSFASSLLWRWNNVSDRGNQSFFDVWFVLHICLVADLDVNRQLLNCKGGFSRSKKSSRSGQNSGVQNIDKNLVAIQTEMQEAGFVLQSHHNFIQFWRIWMYFEHNHNGIKWHVDFSWHFRGLRSIQRQWRCTWRKSAEESRRLRWVSICFDAPKGSKCPRNMTSNSHPIGSMYAIYSNIYHQYTPNVSIYTIHGSYGHGISMEFPSNRLASQSPVVAKSQGMAMHGLGLIHSVFSSAKTSAKRNPLRVSLWKAFNGKWKYCNGLNVRR